MRARVHVSLSYDRTARRHFPSPLFSAVRFQSVPAGSDCSPFFSGLHQHFRCWKWVRRASEGAVVEMEADADMHVGPGVHTAPAAGGMDGSAAASSRVRATAADAAAAGGKAYGHEGRGSAAIGGADGADGSADDGTHGDSTNGSGRASGSGSGGAATDAAAAKSATSGAAGGPMLTDDEKLSFSLRHINEHIQCPLCRGYLRSPHAIVGCLHTFCYECILQAVRDDGLRCPTPGCSSHLGGRIEDKLMYVTVAIMAVFWVKRHLAAKCLALKLARVS